MEISVIIPFHNEEKNVKRVIENVYNFLKENFERFEIIAVDDRSVDKTLQILKTIKKKIRVLRIVRREGDPQKIEVGFAIRDGIKKARYKTITTMMGDGSDDPKDLLKMVKKIEEGYDLVCGSRFIEGGRVYDYPFLKLIANRIYNKTFSFIFDLELKDFTNAFKCFKREIFEEIKIESSGFEWSGEVVIKAKAKGFKVTEVPVSWKGRRYGRSKLGTFKISPKFLYKDLPKIGFMYLKLLRMFKPSIVMCISTFFIILSIFLQLYLLFNTSLFADEGTHLLLSRFYRDLIFYIISTKTLSFSRIYKFGINYLVTYPKLQIAYPPIFHFTNALVSFSLLGTNWVAGRITNFTYFILSLILMYIIVKRKFDSETAWTSLIIFISLPFGFPFTFRVMKDFCVVFWFLLSYYLYHKFLEKNSKIFLILFSTSIAFSVLSERFMILSPLFYLADFLLIRKRKEIKPIIISASIVFLILLPYGLLMLKLDILKINYLVGFWYAKIQGEPTNYFSLQFWLYYLMKDIFQFPILPIYFTLFIIYSLRKEKSWKELFLWFLIFYLGISSIPNKETRFSILFLFPIVFSSSSFIKKDFKIFLTFVFISLLFIFSNFQQTYIYYPAQKISKEVYQTVKESGGNVGMLSEGDPLYSSVLMWHLSELDKNREIRVFRACAFRNKTGDEIKEFLFKNNIRLIVDLKEKELVNPNKIPFLESVGEIDGTYFYKVNGNFTEIEECNIICLTNEKICVS